MQGIEVQQVAVLAGGGDAEDVLERLGVGVAGGEGFDLRLDVRGGERKKTGREKGG
jgi:hypothetical protein